MIRTIQTEEITRNIKEMCIEANHFLAEDMELFPAVEKGFSYLMLFTDDVKIDLNLLPYFTLLMFTHVIFSLITQERIL